MLRIKFILKIAFTAAVAFLMQLYLPWWSVAMAGFLIGFILSSSKSSSFVAGFLGISIYWGMLALSIDNANDHILSTRVAELFYLPGPSALILVTALIGGIVGGLGALAGSQLREFFLPSIKLS